MTGALPYEPCQPPHGSCALMSGHVGPHHGYPENIRRVVDVAKAEALREAADEFRTRAAQVWGGERSWLTTGYHVANLAADWLTESADDLTGGEE